MAIRWSARWRSTWRYLVIGLALIGPFGRPASVLTARPEQLQVALEQWLADQPRPVSVAVAVARTGESVPLWTGEAHHATPLLDVSDEYGVLSITKTFTEALVLREVAAGRIALDKPVPRINGVAADRTYPRITPRMLLQHTSGLVNYPNAVGYDPDKPITPRQIVSSALRSPRTSPPGLRAEYSNTNFHWLGLLLERATGRSYAELVDTLARDLGLAHTRLDPTGRPGWIGYASGGVRSTVADLARWGAALFTPDRVLPEPQLTALTTLTDAGVTLGLWPLCPCWTEPDGTRRATALHQSVANGGLFYFPDRGVVVVVHYEMGADVGEVDPAGLARILHDAIEDRGSG